MDLILCPGVHLKMIKVTNSVPCGTVFVNFITLRNVYEQNAVNKN